MPFGRFVDEIGRIGKDVRGSKWGNKYWGLGVSGEGIVDYEYGE